MHELRYLHAFFDGDVDTALVQCEAMFAIPDNPEVGGEHRRLRARALVSTCRLDLRREDASALEALGDAIHTLMEAGRRLSVPDAPIAAGIQVA